MENFKLDKNIDLICMKAESFPEGIIDAQENLRGKKIKSVERNYFGISYMYDDAILYMAAVECKPHESIPEGCEKYTIRKGNYISIYVSDFKKNLERVGAAFQELTDDPRIDEQGCCVECYLPEGSDHSTAKDIRCMVRLAD